MERKVHLVERDNEAEVMWKENKFFDVVFARNYFNHILLKIFTFLCWSDLSNVAVLSKAIFRLIKHDSTLRMYLETERRIESYGRPLVFFVRDRNPERFQLVKYMVETRKYEVTEDVLNAADSVKMVKYLLSRKPGGDACWGKTIQQKIVQFYEESDPRHAIMNYLMLSPELDSIINEDLMPDLNPLALCVRYMDKLAILDSLVSRGADINHRYEDGNSLLHLACRAEKIGMVRRLLAHGLPVNIENDMRRNPLFSLLNQRRPMTILYIEEILELLIRDGLSINHLDSLNETALETFCRTARDQFAYRPSIKLNVMRQLFASMHGEGERRTWAYRALASLLGGGDTDIIDASIFEATQLFLLQGALTPKREKSPILWVVLRHLDKRSFIGQRIRIWNRYVELWFLTVGRQNMRFEMSDLAPFFPPLEMARSEFEDFFLSENKKIEDYLTLRSSHVEEL